MNRVQLTVGGVGLKKGRIVNSQKAMIGLAKMINPYLIESDFLKPAPFSLISFIFRYGDKFSELPDIDPIDTKNDELPVSVEVPLNELRTASLEEVTSAFASVLLPALLLVAKRYNLSEKGIIRFCKEYGFETDT